MVKTYQSIRGTHDFGPQETRLFNMLVCMARDIFKRCGYEEISLPILEEEGLFKRGVGEATDIVERQMFKIQDKEIVLRPEGTAQVIRYYLENALHTQSDFYKFSYIGPMFRGERPQKGRLRQFHHIGVEAIGSAQPLIDAEVVSVALSILEAMGITQKTLKINTLGCAEDKERFARSLHQSLAERKKELCEDCQRRLEKNPLRIVDCKEERCKKVVASLALGDSHLCESCRLHFRAVLALLDGLGISYTHSPYLVRGLDYYTNTVFEITSEALGSQDAVGAGGRYNNLITRLGGPDIPAIGFAFGVERVLLLLKESGEGAAIKVFVSVIGETLRQESLNLIQTIRQAGISCDTDYCAKSLKAQLRTAERKGAQFVIIMGEEEWKEGAVMIKNMAQSTQEKIKKQDILSFLKRYA
ncbi:MAG: histidine--tRNA ligase [Candidatus Omnitrophota bacterium]